MQIGFFACVQYFNLRVIYLTPRLNYNNFLKFNMATSILDFQNLISEHWDPLGFRFSISVQNLVQKCWSTPKLWPKIEIQDGGRPPSWIFENLISEHWVPLVCRFSITVTNFAQKCWSMPKLRPKIEIQDGGSPPSWIFENLIFEHWDPSGCRFSILV